MKDLHYKTAKYLCKNYETIYLGDINSKSIMSKKKDEKKNKHLNRIISSISYFKFKEIMKNKSEEYNIKLKLISEYMTSKTCNNCLKIKADLGEDKIYKCNNKKCKHNKDPIDRDVNAAINIYNDISGY